MTGPAKSVPPTYALGDAEPFDRGDRAQRRAEEVLRSVGQAGRDEIWIAPVRPDALRTEAEAIDRRSAAGELLPLLGLAFAVKDNIDVAGIETTAGCPAYAYTPSTSSPAVDALRSAGALFVGKTNLDQFATGLVGTRSPYGAVRNAWSPTHIAGGSSSGSAVAVALGLVDLALGTDTAGSGRVPAALNNIVGFKGTCGAVSVRGVVPACRSFDCVTVFASNVARAREAFGVISGFDADDPHSRRPPDSSGKALVPVVAHPGLDALGDLDSARKLCFADALGRLVAAGCRSVEVDIELFLETGRLLYSGGFVAERHAAVGSWVEAHRSDVDPTVAEIIISAGLLPATRLAADIDLLASLRRSVEQLFVASGAHSLLLPTVGFHPTIDQVGDDPIGVNTRLGRYTTFANLLDMCAVAVPAGTVGGLPFGVSVLGPAWSDELQGDLAAIVEAPARQVPVTTGADQGLVRLVVAGAHMRGQPLNHQLTDCGGRFVADGRTSPSYRLYALDTTPQKPGLVRVEAAGRSMEVELWDLPVVGFGRLVEAVPAPMVIGSVEMEDRSTHPGFLCEPVAIFAGLDISDHGGWRAYLGSVSAPPIG